MYTILKMIAATALGAGVAWLVQERRIRQAHFDENFGMLTRAGLDARLKRLRGAADVLFIDLDRIHQLNELMGYTQVNRTIRQAFALRSGDTLIGRWQSGDELVIITRHGDGQGLADRLQARLAEFGLSATIAVASAGPRAAIETAAARVQAAKRNGDRGVVLCC